MDAHLGVTTCDKCGKPIKKGEKTIVISEGIIKNSNSELYYQGSDVRFACHLGCWDGVEADRV